MSEFVPLATFIIAFCAVFSALGLMFNILLKPVKDNQARIESEQKDIKARMELEQKEIKILFQKQTDEFKNEIMGIKEEIISIKRKL